MGSERGYPCSSENTEVQKMIPVLGYYSMISPLEVQSARL